jgi:glycosyltransferase involved in cell wall biosynthesis
MHLAIDASNIRQGGGVTHLSQLLNAADPLEAGFSRITVWTCYDTANKLPDLPWLTKLCPFWTEGGLIKRILGQQFLLSEEMERWGCDVLFSPGGTIPFNNKLPVVTMSQNMLPFEPIEAERFGRFSPMYLKMRLLRYSQGRSFRRAEGIIFLTEYALRVVGKSLKFLPSSLALIPHGIEPRFIQAPRPQRRLSDCSALNPFRVLYVSILMPYKHQVQVAYAGCQLRAEGMPIEMRFIGESWGKYGHDFKLLLEELDPKHDFLIWSGAEPFDMLHSFYQQADAFVFASSCENLPNILIEAMAAGLPIASSNRGPMPEVLGDAGVYFDPEVPTSIAEALRKLAFDTSLRTNLAEIALLKAQSYSWRRCARETLEFIAQVAKERDRTVDV